ncbi:MAG TPA: SagB/ThcOx family dehydrogenase [Ktedonobacteraceae bacterium]
MLNNDLQATWNYHDGTKHPDGMLLDYSLPYTQDMRPLLFKMYTDLSPRSLPLDSGPGGVSAFQALTSQGTGAVGQRLDLETLTRIFTFSAGITKYLTYRPTGKTIPYRAAACTGALFHIELYLVSGDIPGLEAGVYHFDPQGPAIRQLRAGDYRQVLVEASGHESHVSQAPAILVATDVVWRNAVKYRAREYRHAFWDSGTILANILACAVAYRQPASVITGFVDEMVSRLLDLDPQRELPLELIPLGTEPGIALPPGPSFDRLNLAVQPISDQEGDISAILSMHAASSLPDPEAVEAWRGTPFTGQPASAAGPLIALKPLAGDALPVDPLEQVIKRRGSTREFTHEAITFEQLSTVLYHSLQDIPADFLKLPATAFNDIYLTIHAVEGLQSGAYVLRRDNWSLELLKTGDFRATSGYLGLEQDLPYDASVNIFFLTDLLPILARFGNRGYRAAQLEAGIAGGRMYLASYAQRLGATGLTFYDDAVTEFFSPHARGKSVVFMVALGHKARGR